MLIEKRPADKVLGTVLLHNVADEGGNRVLRKGTWLTREHLDILAALAGAELVVGVLGDDDVREDEAAVVLATALCTDELTMTAPAGGRVNLRSKVDGVLQIDTGRLWQLNMFPGIAAGTRRQHAIVGPNQETDQVCTLKVVPYAISRGVLDQARALAEERPGIIEVRALQKGRRVAMLLVGEEQVHEWLRDAYVAPTLTRLERLGAELLTVEAVSPESGELRAAVERLKVAGDLIVIASQSSIAHEADPILMALQEAGAQSIVSGAPVEPGNLLALAFFPGTPVLCLPGCARGLRRNVVDLVLPRLLLGERLEREDVAALGLGGFLTAAERAGDLS